MCEIKSSREKFTMEDSQSLDKTNNRLSRHEIGIRNTKFEMRLVLSELNHLVDNLKSTNDSREKNKLFDNYMNRNTHKFISLRKNLDIYKIDTNCEEFKDKLLDILNTLNKLVAKDKIHYLEMTLKQFKFYN